VTAVELVRVGDVLKPDRIPVTPDPLKEYVSIGVRSFGKGIFHYESVPGDKLGKLRFFRVNPERLVISNIKGWEGAIAISSQADAGTIASNRFLIYDGMNGAIDLSWVRWFFLSEQGIELIQRASPGSADRNRTLAVKRFEELVIPLPPLEEQRRIASRLTTASDLCARVLSLSGRADDFAFAFASACASARHLSDGEKLNRGWRKCKLGEVLTKSDDRVAVDRGFEYPNIGIYSFGRGVFSKPPIDGASTSAASLWRIRAGQFIYSRLFAFEGAYATVPERFDGYHVSNEFPSFDTDPHALDARWLAAYLRTPAQWEDLASTSVGLGVRRQRVPVESLLGHEVMLPPLPEQRKMIRAIEQVDAVRERNAGSASRVVAVVPALLNQTFASPS
jgi:type I restriction enzyme S subunit